MILPCRAARLRESGTHRGTGAEANVTIPAGLTRFRIDELRQRLVMARLRLHARQHGAGLECGGRK